MRFDLISVMPDMFRALTEQGVCARALKRGLAELVVWNPRDFTADVHRTVDDRPYGGGPGMVMMAEPLEAAIEAAKAAAPSSRVAVGGFTSSTSGAFTAWPPPSTRVAPFGSPSP